MNYASAILIALLLLVVVLAVLWHFSWLHLNGASRSFFAALREWEQALGVHDRYETPWLLMLGDDEYAAPLLTSWGLVPASKSAWFGRWWHGPDGAVLAVPQALFSHGENASVQLKLWRQLLGLLLHARPHRPLDAVLWLCTLDPLLQPATAASAGLAARRKFMDLQQRLGLSLPVYLLVGGIEQQPGVSQLIEQLPADGRDRPLGWSSSYPVNTPWQAEWIDQALALLNAALCESLVELATLKGHIDPDLYRLPEHLLALRDPLQSLCDPVFQGNALGEAPRLRGLYFCATANPDPAEANLDPFADDELSEPAAPLFAQRLWRQRIVAEQGLAQPIGRILDLRQRRHRILAFSAGGIGLVWFCAMLWAWNQRSEDASRLATLLHNDQSLVLSGGAEDSARKRITSFWNLLGQAPRWDYSAVALPGSWVSPFERQLNQLLRERAQRQLFEPVQDKIQRDLEGLSDRRTDGGSETDYQRATQLVQRSLSLESQYKRFVQAVEGDLRPLDDISVVANDLFGLSLQGQTLFFDPYYNRTLTRLPLVLASGTQVSEAGTRVSASYLASMRAWLDKLFGGDSFASTAGYLTVHLRSLQSGQRNSLGELEVLGEQIDHLRQLIGLSNVVWSQGSGSELAPGYQALLERSRQSSLIGPQVVQQVENHADNLRRTFHDRWLEQSNDQQGLLRQQKGGSLELQSHVDKLDQSVEALLRQDFSQAALSQGAAVGGRPSLRNLDSLALEEALRFHASYQTYLQQDVAELPPIYRKAVIGAAQAATATAMWQRLNESPPNPLQSSPLGDRREFELSPVKALEVLHVFTSFADTGHADALRRELDSRALNDIHRADQQINALPIFSQPLDFAAWNGNQNLALNHYRVADQPSLKQTFAQQFKLIADQLSNNRGALDWLNAERERLRPSDQATLDTFLDMAVQMQKYNEQNPISSPVLFEQLVNRDFNQMDTGNCATVLAAVKLSEGRGELAALTHTYREQALQRCASLQVGHAAQAWQQLSGYFNQFLAGRFPFAYDGGVSDANPDRVREFLELIDTQLPIALTGLNNPYGPDSPVARAFLEQLSDARLWLGPMLLRDKEGLRGVDLEIRWRTDRDDERGADQVIDWNFNAGGRQASYPGELSSQARWSVGEPVQLGLRWAIGSAQRPIPDAHQAALSVADLQAEWSYEGPWALLRFIRANQAVERFPAADSVDRPLALQLPVRTQANQDARALMFMRLSLKAIGGKQALALTPLPVSAPASPFGSLALTPLAGIEVLP